MNGAELLITTAETAGVDICFANPGTTEMPLVNALDSATSMRAILCLFEGVCTEAADSYARMRGTPALTLLHLGPGLGNGIANLHNARRARSPIVNIIGDHASWHVAADPPHNMDIDGLALTVSGWSGQVKGPDQISPQTAGAISAALRGQVATLSIPSDYQEATIDDPQIAPVQRSVAPVVVDDIESAARLLRSAARPALILGGDALLRDQLLTVERIRAACDCRLFAETFAGRAEGGVGLPIVERIPYFPEQALAALADYDAFVLVNARRPVAFFGYSGVPSYFIAEETESVGIGGDGQDTLQVLQALADALDTPQHVAASNGRLLRPELPQGDLTPATIGAVIAALQPENAIIVNEGVSSGRGYEQLARSTAPFTTLYATGGAIGWGIPGALGAALACPERPVICLEADGSGMYNLQGLWTQAREGLNVTTLICSNRRYKILQTELARAGIHEPGPVADSLTDLGRPEIGWASLAQGMGVPATTVHRAEELANALQNALVEPGPHLIDMVMA